MLTYLLTLNAVVMTPIISLRGVSERDVDLLLLEELAASEEFRSWFAESVHLPPGSELEEVARSVTSSTGESDLELIYRNQTGVTKVLVENKIDAVLQPRQPERYGERGRAYVEAGSCDNILTVLIAPEVYAADETSFDVRISYEAMREWFQERAVEDNRAKYKLELLDGAIARGRRGWTLVPDKAATSFWASYWRLASSIAPQLQMPAPGVKPATSSFIRFQTRYNRSWS